jgi:hypothetical protein
MDIKQPVTNIYDAYSISSEEENDINNIFEPTTKIMLPSEISTNNTNNTTNTNNTSSDTESDDYNEHNIIMNNRRKPSFVKKSLKSFSTRIDILPEKIKETMIIEKLKSPRLCYIRHKALYGMTLFTLVIISLIIIF